MRVKVLTSSTFLSVALSIGFTTGTWAQNSCTPPAVGCSNVDFSNAYLNVSSITTIEYDNMVSLDHATLARQSDGTIKVWGEDMASSGVDNVLTPQLLDSINYPALTGSILKFTGGTATAFNSAQFAVLTTDGLFLWGRVGGLVNSGIKSTTVLERITVNGKLDGLPLGVSPGDVKMLFGSYRALALVTCSGDVWVLSFGGSKNGDGTPNNATNNIIWHQVKTDATTNLTNVMAVRGYFQSLIALKSDGTVWTWGLSTYLGDNTAKTGRTFATQMTLPAGAIPKMIGASSATGNNITYYLLGINGNLYTLGWNGEKLLGNFSAIAQSLNWIQVQKSATPGDYMSNVAWISPNEHSMLNPAINILTTNGDLYAWGFNGGNMIGGPANGQDMNPTLYKV